MKHGSSDFMIDNIALNELLIVVLRKHIEVSYRHYQWLIHETIWQVHSNPTLPAASSRIHCWLPITLPSFSLRMSEPVPLVIGTHTWAPHNEEEVGKILDVMRKHQLTNLDTARLYVCSGPLNSNLMQAI